MASENLNVVFGSLVGLGAVQFVAIVFAFCICKVKSVILVRFHWQIAFRVLDCMRGKSITATNKKTRSASPGF